MLNILKRRKQLSVYPVPIWMELLPGEKVHELPVGLGRGCHTNDILSMVSEGAVKKYLAKNKFKMIRKKPKPPPQSSSIEKVRESITSVLNIFKHEDETKDKEKEEEKKPEEGERKRSKIPVRKPKTKKLN